MLHVRVEKGSYFVLGLPHGVAHLSQALLAKDQSDDLATVTAIDNAIQLHTAASEQSFKSDAPKAIFFALDVSTSMERRDSSTESRLGICQASLAHMIDNQCATPRPARQKHLTAVVLTCLCPALLRDLSDLSNLRLQVYYL